MTDQNRSKYYQVSTLQALAQGFSKSVITVDELLVHGDMGLGTFEDVDGEMIVLDGKWYCQDRLTLFPQLFSAEYYCR